MKYYIKYGLTANRLQVIVRNKKDERKVWPLLDKLTKLLQSGCPRGEVEGLKYRVTKNVIGVVVKVGG